jgi:glycosyltransferase involved in cell wall biosynthesis
MSIAIVTITLNNLAGLRRTLASVEAQTTPPDEHWIIDGGSTDGTREFLQNLPPRPGRHFVSEPDRGIYDAMNKGVALAASDFVWFLNAGDACADERVVADLGAALRSHPGLDGLYGKVWCESAYGRRSVGRPVGPKDFRTRMAVGHPAILYRRLMLVDTPYPTQYRIISDWVLTRSLFDRGARFTFIDRHFAIYDMGGISSRAHFRLLREQLRHEPGWIGKLLLLVVCGGRYTRLWLSKKLGIYHLYKLYEHRGQRRRA